MNGPYQSIEWLEGVPAALVQELETHGGQAVVLHHRGGGQAPVGVHQLELSPVECTQGRHIRVHALMDERSLSLGICSRVMK